jgi:hypothetical protein
MKKFRNRAILQAIAMLLLLSGIMSCSITKPGGKTPAEVLRRLVAATHNRDRDELAKCLDVYVRFNPAAGKTFADEQLMLMQDAQQLVIDGVKKYGVKDFANALGVGGLMIAFSGEAMLGEQFIHGEEWQSDNNG